MQNSTTKIQIGTWNIGKTIGGGTSSRVKIAINSVSGKKCVVKAIERPCLKTELTQHSSTLAKKGINRPADTETVERLRKKVYKRELYLIREAWISSVLRHESLVVFRQSMLGKFGKTLGTKHFFLFFDYIEGMDLQDYLFNQKRLTETETGMIAIQIADALFYMHSNNTAHRDVKLENIRYNPHTRKATLLDFGFSNFYIDSMETNCGSPCYAAPEIYQGVPYSGEAVDMWAFGVCVYNMITGRMPFDGPSFLSLKYKVADSPVEFPVPICAEIQSFLLEALEKQPEKRPRFSNLKNNKFFKKYAKPHHFKKVKALFDKAFLDKFNELDTTEQGQELLKLLNLDHTHTTHTIKQQKQVTLKSSSDTICNEVEQELKPGNWLKVTASRINRIFKTIIDFRLKQ